jgi:uncharacterized protein (TIGR00299 family) protein
VRDLARRIFRKLGEAEAAVHRMPLEQVHFHEVGAVDAIVDVVGSAAALAYVGAEVLASPLPMGRGFVKARHGVLPLPPPAVVECLRGLPTYDGGIDFELVTPTGAAILATLAVPGALPAMTLEAVGQGAGARELPIANLLRILVGRATGGGATPEAERLVAVETTVDDMSPQLYEPVIERLFEAGALDVYLTPVIMKRSRPGVVLTALARPERRADLAAVLFRETTTIGVRWSEVRRTGLPREMVRLETTMGPVTFKVSRLEGRPITVTPEFEEVRRIARERGMPVRAVLEALRGEGTRALGDS